MRETRRFCRVLCSRSSVHRPWINFEAGCVWWLKDLTSVIPICHAGQTKDRLPIPLSEFQALEISDPDFVKNVITAIAKHTSQSDLRRIDEEAIWKELAKVFSELSHESRKVEVRIDFPGREGTTTFLAVPKADPIEEVARRTGFDLAKYSVEWHLRDSSGRFVGKDEGKLRGFRAAFYGSKTRLVLTKSTAVKDDNHVA